MILHPCLFNFWGAVSRYRQKVTREIHGIDTDTFQKWVKDIDTDTFQKWVKDIDTFTSLTPHSRDGAPSTGSDTLPHFHLLLFGRREYEKKDDTGGSESGERLSERKFAGSFI